MVFSTILFLCVFLPLSLIGYYLLPKRFKNTFLLLCSLLFYAWGEPKFIWVMLLSIACNYGFGMWIHRLAFAEEAGTSERKKKLVAALAVGLNLGILFVFKYFTFVSETIQTVLHGNFEVIRIALPIGISFYTFQGLSYIIDIYRKEGTLAPSGERISIVQKNPFRLALYIAMFPQLIAGPIVRYEDIRVQLTERKESAGQFAEGIERFVVGLAKKAILANVVGKLAESIFAAQYVYLSQGAAWLGAFAYTLQIYFDFSGYSDMAIGLGEMFGFHFQENFNYPYISTSIREFWRRWHISLSGWFRDYLYIPLGGSRRGNVYIHLLLVFVATGIWHGAGWGFLIWGLWHGAFLILERLCSRHAVTDDRKHRVPQLFSWMYTMLVVMVGWVVFRIVDLRQALTYLAVMFGIRRNAFTAFGIRHYLTNRNLFFLLVACICALPIAPKIRIKLGTSSAALLLVKRAVLLLLLALSFLFIINSSYNPFIYFRF